MSIEPIRGQPRLTNSPIFIVGCGRSGTTLLYELLASHPDVAWFSNLGEKGRGYALLVGLHLVPNHILMKVGVKPSEGYPLWDICIPPTADDPPLTEKNASERVTRCAHALVAKQVRVQRKSRFLNKNTRNSRRIRFLHAIFPTGFFIHVIRDPVAVVASLLNVPWWPDLPLWTEGGRTPRELTEIGRHPTQLAAELWVREVEQIQSDKTVLPEGRYIEVVYEKMTQAPLESLQDIETATRLQPDEDFHRRLTSLTLQSRNHRARQRLSSTDSDMIERICGGTYSRLRQG